MPLTSFILPGLDQWIEGQYGNARFYTSTSLISGLIASYLTNKDKDAQDALTIIPAAPNNQLKFLAYKTSELVSELSLYQSFHTAVGTRKPYGEYNFLKSPESIKKITSAPFKFSFLKRPSTYVPLGIVGVLASLLLKNPTAPSLHSSIFSLGISYNAGVGEEALFRGWMMPVIREYTTFDNISNITTSAIFAAAHISEHQQNVLPQFLLGYYFGYITQKNDWQISEAIFIHSWWDVIVFLSSYMTNEALEQNNQVSLPDIHFPPLTVYF